MPYAEILPGIVLRGLVKRYWAISAPYEEHRVLPDGCIDVLVLGGLGARVVGTMTRAFFAPAGMRSLVGVRFHPGEAARLIPEAPRELTDAQAQLETLWIEEGRVIEDAVGSVLELHAQTPEKILTRVAPVLDALLLARLGKHDRGADVRVRRAVIVLAQGETVASAAMRVCLSERQLARRFVDRVGVSPKIFGRVMRLQHAANLLARGKTASAAASEAGYADQAHFTHDTKALAGIAPAALARELAQRALIDFGAPGS